MNNDKNYYKILTIGFSVFLVGIASFNILSNDKRFSEFENRMLAQKPKFSIDRLMSGRYTDKFEKYKVDQFMGRDFFMRVKSSTELLIGKRENNGVYYGKDGYLIEVFNPVEDKYIEKNLQAINNFSNKFKDINSYISIIPTAISVLEDKLPTNLENNTQLEYIQNTKKNLGDNIKYIDTYDALSKNSDNYIFYKTDHHWTSEGAYISFNKIKYEMNLKGNNIKYNKLEISDNFSGTLVSKSGFRNDEKDSIYAYLPENNTTKVIVSNIEQQEKSPSLYNTEKLNKKDKYEVFLGGNYPILEINSNAQTDKELLLIKDSYANSIIPFLVDYYSKIIVVDPRYYYDDIEELVNNNNINDILYLYNANTFYSDKSLSVVLNNE